MDGAVGSVHKATRGYGRGLPSDDDDQEEYLAVDAPRSRGRGLPQFADDEDEYLGVSAGGGSVHSARRAVQRAPEDDQEEYLAVDAPRSRGRGLPQFADDEDEYLGVSAGGGSVHSAHRAVQAAPEDEYLATPGAPLGRGTSTRGLLYPQRRAQAASNDQDEYLGVDGGSGGGGQHKRPSMFEDDDSYNDIGGIDDETDPIVVGGGAAVSSARRVAQAPLPHSSSWADGADSDDETPYHESDVVLNKHEIDTDELDTAVAETAGGNFFFARPATNDAWQAQETSVWETADDADEIDEQPSALSSDAPDMSERAFNDSARPLQRVRGSVHGRPRTTASDAPMTSERAVNEALDGDDDDGADDDVLVPMRNNPTRTGTDTSATWSVNSIDVDLDDDDVDAEGGNTAAQAEGEEALPASAFRLAAAGKLGTRESGRKMNQRIGKFAAKPKAITPRVTSMMMDIDEDAVEPTTV
jgi:hypothetical protein